MTDGYRVLTRGSVDPDGVRGPDGTLVARWAELGVAAPGTPASFRELFDRRDKNFRRIDSPSRALVVAAAAADLDPQLDPLDRDAVAVVLATVLGSLDTDRRFARTLERGIPEGPLFAYTLPNIPLGELTLRHGLRGPSLCLSTDAEPQALARQHAGLLLRNGEAPRALACSVDVLAEAVGDLQPTCIAQVELLAPA